MSDNADRRQTRRISSILKNVASIADSPTQTFSRHTKRISFSHVNNIKEFVVDGNNRTIKWGESYEKSDSAIKAGSSEASSVTNGVTCDHHTQQEISSVAPTPTIDLFADIDDVTTSDVEMDVSFNQSDSPTKLFNQSMFIEEPTTTSVTNYKLVEMSIIGNKRKTIETISADKVSTDVTKSVKVRKMNDENAEPVSNIPILHHAGISVTSNDCKPTLKPAVNLNTTRIVDADDDVHEQRPMKPSPPTLFDSDTGTSKMLDKTLISTADMTVDNQSMSSSISDISKPTANKTHIYGRGDISAGIDQTFAVQNPLLENTGWNELTEQNVSENCETDNVPAFQSRFGNSRNSLLEDLSIKMDIRFKDRSVSPNFLSRDEQGIEDLTISMETTFKAEVSDDNGTDIDRQSIKKSFDPTADSIANKHSPQQDQQKSQRSNECLIDVRSNTKGDNKENLFVDASVLPPVNHTLQSTNKTYNATEKHTEDMTLCSVVDIPSRQKTLSPIPDNRTDLQRDKSKYSFYDGSASHDRVYAADCSFAHSEPLSSTRFVPNNKLNFSGSDGNVKVDCSVTFNYCPTLTATQSRDRRSVASLQNNTDELCNLEPDQLRKRSDNKTLFSDVTHGSSNDMLCETKMDLVNITVDESNENLPTKSTACWKNSSLATESMSNVKDLQLADNEVINMDDDSVASNTISAYNEPRCKKCLNCRKSMDGNNTSFLKLEQLNEPKLDFSIYDQFKGLASFKDVIEARKKRAAVRKLENELLVDQNVEAPDIRVLWKNKKEETKEPSPVYVPEPLICLPMRMNIQFLMRNKIRTEYTQWKYFDNFFYIGAIAMRHEKIPSIRIHIKFDGPNKGPMKADTLNMPLVFTKVFIEECPTYLRSISPGNLLKHRYALALLPINLATILSDSVSIYKGLEEIDGYFQTAVAKINEVDLLTVEHHAFLKMADSTRTCYIEKPVFDIQKYLMYQIVIQLDNIETVGPRNVFFDPYCETTDDFKKLPVGLPFLRTFLIDPKAYLLPFLQG